MFSALLLCLPCVCSGYSEHKLSENVEAEIMQVCLDEAKEAWPEQQVVELASNNTSELESNSQRCVQWIQQYMVDHQ